MIRILAAACCAIVLSTRVDAAPPALVTPNLPNAYANVPYSASLMAGGNPPPASVNVTGLPTGLIATYNGSGSVLISGTTAQAGDYSLSVAAANADGSRSATVILKVRPYFAGATALSTAKAQSCAVVNGGVRCWGATSFNTFDTSTGVNQPIAAGSGATAVGVGAQHDCAVVNGGVACWGNNSYKQLGYDTDYYYSNVPGYALPPGSGATAVAATAYSTCAVVDGGVKCWGAYSLLGARVTPDFGTVGTKTPVQAIPAGSGVTAIAAGNEHTCAVVGDGLKCWGYNYSGELGPTATRGLVYEPTDALPPGSGVIAVAAAGGQAEFISTDLAHTCAVANGGVKCWGSNTDGQLGDGTTTTTATPVQPIPAGSGASAVAAGPNHTCAAIGGGVRCWGRNSSGQLGDGSLSQSSVAVQAIAPSSLVTAVGAGDFHSCAIVAGAPQCWGSDSLTRLGDGPVAFDSFPSQLVPTGSGAAAVGSGAPCIVLNGGVVCTGSDRSAQLWPSGGGATAFAQRGDNRCVLAIGGVQCWGSNGYGQIGDGTQNRRDVPPAVPYPAIPAGSNATAIAMSDYGSCAIVDGGLTCWGGVGGSWPVKPVALIPPGSGVTAVELGDDFTKNQTLPCVVANGGVRCLSETPQQVIAEGSGVAALALGGAGGSKCAVVNGGVQCWGFNTYGQLGDGTTTNRATPVQTLPSGSGVTAIASDGFGMCAIAQGGVMCWGQGDSYNLVSGKPSTPTDLVPSGAGVTQIASRRAGFCLLVNDGVACWGGNTSWELAGRGSTPGRRIPVVLESNLSITHSFSYNVTGAASGKDFATDVVVHNAGPASAQGVGISITLDPGVRFVWANNPSCAEASGVVTCNIGTVASSGLGYVRLVLRPNSAGTFTNVAAVNAPSADDPDHTDDTASFTYTATATPVGVPTLRYRLYSPVTREHHFTTDLNEYNTLGASGNWVQEGTVGKVLDNPGTYNGVTAVPYYRLYDTTSRWHHWTTDPNEYYTLAGYWWWNAEGVDGYLLPTQAPGTIPLFRLVYPPVGNLHHWTIDQYEYDTLIAVYGWYGEGGSGFVIP